MSGFAASRAQRGKIRDKPCVFCGHLAVDPMHVIPRSLGGCDHPDCVVPACRQCHRAYDLGALDALPFLEPAYRTELAHALTHVGLEALRWRVTNTRLAA